MDSSKRAFMQGGAVMLAGLSIAPLSAFAKEGGVVLFLEASDGRNDAKEQLALDSKQMAQFQELQGRKRPEYLADIILRWLKRRFPDINWPVMGNDLTQRMVKAMGGTGILEGDVIAMIKIKLRVKFDPPDKWEVTLEISF